MEKNYVVTVTSGSYDDYEHGCLFAVKNEEQGLKIVDLLNAYSNFRNKLREEFVHALINGKYTETEKLKAEYNPSDDFKMLEKILKNYTDFSWRIDTLDSWPEDCVFALEALPVVEFENGN